MHNSLESDHEDSIDARATDDSDAPVEAPRGPACGTLFVVATPIGNLEDMSPRAVSTLQQADLVVAEDTRHTGKLLMRFGIRAKLRALHEHNEARVAPELVAMIKAGHNVVLVSDAGTPLISDPGYVLVDAALSANATVIPIPGPCALVAALSVSGMPTDRFVFEGFLPARTVARQQRLQILATELRTSIVYEAPHRIVATLEDCVAVLGPDRVVTIAKELSKIHEQVFRGATTAALAWLEAVPARQRGEFVLVLSGASAQPAPRQDWHRDLELLLEELSPARASRVLAKMTGAARKDIYQAALALSADD